MSEARKMNKYARKQRMYRKKYGEDTFIEFQEHCFDFDNKNYIIRDDLEAEKYAIARMKASVARNVKAEDYRQTFVSRKNLKILEGKRAGSVSPVIKESERMTVTKLPDTSSINQTSQ